MISCRRYSRYLRFWRLHFFRCLIWLLALRCEQCHQPRLSVLCAPCAAQLPRIGQHCRSCTNPVAFRDERCARCLSKPTGLDALTVRWQFRAQVRALVWRAKFQADRAALQALVQEARRLAQTLPFAVDAVVPMPIAPTRLRQRGFNQTIFLARAVAQVLRIPVTGGVIYRYHRAQQSKIKQRSARLSNIHGAFYSKKPVPARRILLVDDVLTSGATVNEAARTLKAAGAVFVGALVIAAS